MSDNYWDTFQTENSGGGKGISFGQIGDRSQIGVIKGGIVLEIKKMSQQIDYNTKLPAVYDKGSRAGQPKMQLPILLRTDERDPLNPEDDGHRVLYVKGLMVDAIKEALAAVDAKTLEVGGDLRIAYVGDRQIDKANMRAFKAKYTKAPPQVADQSAFFGTTAGQQAAPPVQPVQQAGGAVTPDPWAAQPQRPVQSPYTNPAPAGDVNPFG
jgi:hypothetical protein